MVRVRPVDSELNDLAERAAALLKQRGETIAVCESAAGGLISANWLYDVAPKDGSAVGISVPNIALAHVLDTGSIKYDARKFNWIGRIVSPTATLYTWHTSKTKTVADLKAKGVEFIDAAPRQGAHGSRIAFIHPSSGCGLLIEIKQPAGAHA